MATEAEIDRDNARDAALFRYMESVTQWSGQMWINDCGKMRLIKGSSLREAMRTALCDFGETA